MSDDKPYHNGFQRRAVEALLCDGLTVDLDINGEIHVYGSDNDGITTLQPELEPYTITTITALEGVNFAFRATLRADWSEVDFDNEPYQEDGNE